MRHRLKWSIQLWAEGLSKGDEHPAHAAHGVWHSPPYRSLSSSVMYSSFVLVKLKYVCFYVSDGVCIVQIRCPAGHGCISKCRLWIAGSDIAMKATDVLCSHSAPVMTGFLLPLCLLNCVICGELLVSSLVQCSIVRRMNEVILH